MLRQADVGKFAGSPQFQAQKSEREAALRGISELQRARSVAGRGSDEIDDDADAPRRAVDPFVQARLDQQRAELGTRLDAAVQTLKSIEDRLWRDYPRYMELIAPRPVTVQDLQQRLLKPGETVLSYFLLPQAAAVFVVSRERLSVHVVPQKREEVVKLVRAARSLQDALEGALQDMGAFMNIEDTGSIEFDLNFGISSVNAQLLAVYVQAYKEGALPLEALLTALKDGKLSDEFDVEDAAIEMLAAKDEQDAADAEAAAAKLEAIGNAPMAPGAPKAPDMPMKGKE